MIASTGANCLLADEPGITAVQNGVRDETMSMHRFQKLHCEQ
jgi:hypothetical protein